MANATLRGYLALTIWHTVEFSRSGRASFQFLSVLIGGNRSNLVFPAPPGQTRQFSGVSRLTCPSGPLPVIVLLTVVNLTFSGRFRSPGSGQCVLRCPGLSVLRLDNNTLTRPAGQAGGFPGVSSPQSGVPAPARRATASVRLPRRSTANRPCRKSCAVNRAVSSVTLALFR